ncbi:4-(cytidine 5'-diphospho)-2-C-methyl-D-erythritol kinase [Planosporangium flavigriseum]|uniref:4-diphosphocytidyl-2-C-methyl-D-erythritol kinase n=1 Tax=Planosporangium flavigriseum TaxID=373681 RepID=A0A8J3LFU2_9ACTN|nr:4-(cytidine 5'-diphospho)-2-C-methyl-D-erythritol kinase [Planosporangium flavigriseum]NJC63540.1 4-(cytidine 5'-diphospho)-2-C-methyl-D-erythritol kinase [Planosporangium flavigriseum]GIG72237.1 4-diphosphocytidyl-2-C-methyl-D-erythritol kinase [Planosporangium flavigriseum]
MTEPLDEEEYERPRLGSAGPVRVRVPAKINLHLHVGPVRGDGFHELVTVYHAISLYDELSARRGDRLTLTMEGEGAGELPLDDDNLVLRAARALARYTQRQPLARLHLRKQIPIAAGLAGGSADAAAALVACDALWGTNLGRDELAKLAASIGSDVPFLVLGGTALGTGRGERVSPVLASGHSWHWVVAVANGGLSTPTVYRELDHLRDYGAAPPSAGSPERLLAALRQHDPAVLAAALGNDLQPAALSLRPELRHTLDAGHAAGALAGIVSGSGPTCVFLAADARHAESLAKELVDRGACRSAQPAYGPVAGARVV